VRPLSRHIAVFHTGLHVKREDWVRVGQPEGDHIHRCLSMCDQCHPAKKLLKESSGTGLSHLSDLAQQLEASINHPAQVGSWLLGRAEVS